MWLHWCVPMSAGRLHRAHGLAWLYVCLHLAAHVIEEAATGFLDVWNPVLAAASQRTGLPLPQFAFGEWLTILIGAVASLLALTPRISRGAAWTIDASYVLAAIMIANGVHHLLSPLYLGRFLPGHYTSPLLIFASVWLIATARAVARQRGGRRSRATALAGTLLFLIAAPGTVAVWIPYAITGWALAPPLLGGALRVAGVMLVLAGTVALVECFVRFALMGRGTPAPVAPTETLVASGLYRHTRNPMYVAVLAVLAGQAILFGSLALLSYTALVWLCAHAFVVSYEEPALASQFAGSYEDYRAHVPRWIPRLTPYRSGRAHVPSG